MPLSYLGRLPAFGFVVHPRDENDLFRAKCLSLLRSLSTSDADFLRRVRALPPMIVGDVILGFTPFCGELVSIACLASQVVSARGREQILRAASMMADRGARVIGLGALTAPATAGGSWLADRMRGVTITNGNAYTAAVLRHNTLSAVEALALNRRACIAVVGCTGSVGGTVSRLLVDAGCDLVLVGRTVSKGRELLGDLASAARFSENLADVAAADVVLVLTSDPSARLTPAVIGAGAVVIDASEPANISDEHARAWSAYATIVRGGRVRIPDYYCSCDVGLGDATESFACLAETYLFAREGIREHSVGVPTTDFANRLERAALRHGVRPSFEMPDMANRVRRSDHRLAEVATP